MSEKAILPKLGLTMTEDLITRVRVKLGDTVKAGQEIIDFETDKIASSVEAPCDRIMLAIYVASDQMVPVLEPVCLIGRADEGSAVSASIGADGSGRAFASPMARKVARHSGVDLGTVRGTGPCGRIVRADVLAAASLPAGDTGDAVKPIASQTPPGITGGDRRERLGAMRRTIAARLGYSKRNVPHAYFMREADATNLLALML